MNTNVEYVPASSLLWLQVLLTECDGDKFEMWATFSAN